MSITNEHAADYSRERHLVELWARHGALGTRRTAHDAIALGAQLLLIKSATPRGEFKDRVNMLGMQASTAQRYMAVARRFFHLPDAFLDIVGTASNLVELLQLEDEIVNALARGETVNGLLSDALANGAVKSVREAVRAASEQEAMAAAADRVATKLADSRVAREQEAMAAAADRVATQLAGLRPARPVLSVEEERMLRLFRKCEPAGRDALLRVAKVMHKP